MLRSHRISKHESVDVSCPDCEATINTKAHCQTDHGVGVRDLKCPDCGTVSKWDIGTRNPMCVATRNWGIWNHDSTK